MTKNIIWFITIALTSLVQTTWPDFLKFQEVVPDLPLLLVVYFGIADGEERGMYTGLVGGIYQDVAGNTVLGHHVLCLVAVGYLTGRMSMRLITEHPAVKAGLVFFAGLLHGVLYTLIGYVQNPANGAVYPIVASVIPAAFYTALITPLAFFLLDWLFRRREAHAGAL